jgi:hypothetical protein
MKILRIYSILPVYSQVETKRPSATKRHFGDALGCELRNADDKCAKSRQNRVRNGFIRWKGGQVLPHALPPSVTWDSGQKTEIPGETVVIKDQKTIIFSICNVYFEAVRATSEISRTNQ